MFHDLPQPHLEYLLPVPVDFLWAEIAGPGLQTGTNVVGLPSELKCVQGAERIEIQQDAVISDSIWLYELEESKYEFLRKF